ncbi:DUF2853 family protein [Saprospiraceae bacterium]|nr:DUF2853 family protein [Saprospiraceae bacterium]
MKQLEEVGASNLDHDLLYILAGRLRLVIDNKDALLVSGTDDSELETVRRKFVVKKLGVEDKDKDKGMAAVKTVTVKMSGIRMKNRVTFYFLVQQELS